MSMKKNIIKINDENMIYGGKSYTDTEDDNGESK